MRKRIYEIVEVSNDNDPASTVYDIFMLCAIFIGIIPLAFKESHTVFFYTDIVTTILFIVDYLLRFATADYKLNKKELSFLIYPFTGWAIIDLVSILPSITMSKPLSSFMPLFSNAQITPFG